MVELIETESREVVTRGCCGVEKIEEVGKRV